MILAWLQWLAVDFIKVLERLLVVVSGNIKLNPGRPLCVYKMKCHASYWLSSSKWLLLNAFTIALNVWMFIACQVHGQIHVCCCCCCCSVMWSSTMTAHFPTRVFTHQLWKDSTKSSLSLQQKKFQRFLTLFLSQAKEVIRAKYLLRDRVLRKQVWRSNGRLTLKWSQKVSHINVNHAVKRIAALVETKTLLMKKIIIYIYYHLYPTLPVFLPKHDFNGFMRNRLDFKKLIAFISVWQVHMRYNHVCNQTFIYETGWRTATCLAAC